MYFYREKLRNGIFNQYIEAFDFAINALRDQPVKLDRSRWEGCYTCNNISGIMIGEITMCIGKRIVTTESHELKFCPECGKPLTEKAWAELEHRIGCED